MSLAGPDIAQTQQICDLIGENGPDKMETSLALVKEWIDCQPHLPKDYDERLLPTIIRGCKHNLDRTKSKVDTYFSVRNSMPDLFHNRDPLSEEIQNAAKHMTITPLPRLTPDGYRVVVHRWTGAPVAEFEPAGLYKRIFMLSEIRMLEDPLIAGDIFVYDVAQMSASHVAKLATPLTKHALVCAQDAYPQRLKEIHMVNAPPFIDKVLNVYKMFLKEKMRNRFQIHTGHKTLLTSIPQSLLPSDYDGDEKSIETLDVEWNKKLASYADWFDKQHSVVSNEKLRVNKKGANEADSLYGCEGAFRKLAID